MLLQEDKDQSVELNIFRIINYYIIKPQIKSFKKKKVLRDQHDQRMFSYLIGRCDMRSERSSRDPFEEDEEEASSSSVKPDEEHMEGNEHNDKSSSSSENVSAASIDLETPSTISSSSILLESL